MVPLRTSTRQWSCTILLIIVSLFLALVTAAEPTSFCKCTCGQESTIIPLKGTTTCIDCNRQFCLAYNLPICKEIKETDVFTTCFQRDSFKDQAVVLIFIVATGGLLAYAVIRPLLQDWMSRREREAYNALPT